MKLVFRGVGFENHKEHDFAGLPEPSRGCQLGAIPNGLSFFQVNLPFNPNHRWLM